MQGREAKQTQVLVVSVKHCQLRVIYCLVFSYPTLCLQPSKPDKLSCLGHLDETIHFTAHLPPETPFAHLPTGRQKLPKYNQHLWFPLPQTTLALLPLCYYSALSLAQGTCSIWHISPAPAQAPHVLSSTLSHWGSCCCARTLKEKVSKQAQELSSSDSNVRHQILVRFKKNRIKEQGDPWESPFHTYKPQKLCAMKGS